MFREMKSTLPILLILLLSSTAYGAKRYLLPEGAASTGGSFTCPILYVAADKCYNTLDSILHNVINGDNVFVIGSSYTITSAASTYSNEFARINAGISMYSLNVAGSSRFTFTQASSVKDHGLTIASDNVYIENIEIVAAGAVGLDSVVRIVHPDDAASETSKRRTPQDGVPNFYTWKGRLAWKRARHQQHIREFKERLMSPVSFNKRAGSLSDISDITKGSCIDCLCRCGRIREPDVHRTNVTLYSSTLSGSPAKAIVYVNGAFGLSDISIVNSSLIYLDPSSGEQDDSVHHIRIYNNYITDNLFTYNHYGKCIHPNIAMGYCNASQYLPYYTDENFTYKAPLLNSTTGVAYASIDEAVIDHQTSLELRGRLHITDTVYINEGPMAITSTRVQSCCSTIHIHDHVNPGIYAIYENLHLSFLTMALGNNSGGVIVRNGDRIAHVGQFNVSTWETIPVNLMDILPSEVIEDLLDSVHPSIVPSPAEVKRVLLDSVSIVNATSDPFSYGVILFPLDVDAYPNITISRSSVVGGEYGVISMFDQTNIYDSYIDVSKAAIVLNSTFNSIVGNYMRMRTPTSYGLVIANAGTDTPTPTLELVVDNVFYAPDLDSSEALLAYHIPDDFATVNSALIISPTIDTFGTLSADLTGLLTIPSSTQVSLGMEGEAQLNLTLSLGVDHDQYLCRDASLFVIYLPYRVLEQLVQVSPNRRQVPGTLAIFTSGLGSDSNLTSHIVVDKMDSQVADINEIVLISTTYDPIILDYRWNVTDYSNNPPIPTLSAVRRVDITDVGDDRKRSCRSNARNSKRCFIEGTAGIQYQSHTNQYNTNYILASGPISVYVCSNYTEDDTSESGGYLVGSLADAVFEAASEAMIVLCNTYPHVIDECMEMTKGLTIIGDYVDQERSEVTCESQCCCIFNIHEETANNTIIANLRLTDTNQTTGNEECCFPAAIQIGVSLTGAAKDSYIEPHIENITLLNNDITQFKHGIRIGNVFNVSVIGNNLESMDGGILLLHTVTKALARYHPLWAELNGQGSNETADIPLPYFSIYGNNITDCGVGISNTDLSESAPTDSCRDFSKNDDLGNFESVYIPPYDINTNNITGCNTGITLSGVTAFLDYPIQIVDNYFTDNDQGYTLINDSNPQVIGNIPSYASSTVNSLMIESNNVRIYNNYFGTNQDLIIVGRNIWVESNDISDADIRLDPTNPKMLTSARGNFPISNITIIGNDFCMGDLTSSVIHQILHIDSTIERAAIGLYGYHKVNFTENMIASLYNLFVGRDPEGFMLNMNTSLNVNCVDVLLDPDRSLNEYILPPEEGTEEEIQVAAAKQANGRRSSSSQTPTVKRRKITKTRRQFEEDIEEGRKRAIMRNGIARRALFSGTENETIGECSDTAQPTPDLKACEECTLVDIKSFGLLVNLRRNGAGCVRFDMEESSQVKPLGLSVGMSFAFLLVSMVVIVLLICCVFNQTMKDAINKPMKNIAQESQIQSSASSSNTSNSSSKRTTTTMNHKPDLQQKLTHRIPYRQVTSGDESIDQHNRNVVVNIQHPTQQQQTTPYEDQQQHTVYNDYNNHDM